MAEENGTTNGNGAKTKISGATWVQGGVVVSLLSAAVWVGWAYRNNAATIELLGKEQSASLERMSLQFDNRFNALELKLVDRYTGTDAKFWALRLQQANPTLVVPEPSHESR